jgi:hypothetical protein
LNNTRFLHPDYWQRVARRGVDLYGVIRWVERGPGNGHQTLCDLELEAAEHDEAIASTETKFCDAITAPPNVVL